MKVRRPRRLGWRRWGPATAGALLLGASCLGCGSADPVKAGAASPEASAPPASPSPAKPLRPAVFAPYLEVGVNTVGSLADMAEAAHSDLTDLAFIVDKGGCAPGWDGAGPLADPAVLSQVKSLRDAGGQVTIAFGGAESRELANACGSVDALVAAYQKVIDTYALTDMDLDIEGSTLGSASATHRRNLALRQLQRDAQAHGRDLRVTFTLPSDADGPSDKVRALLADAAAAGVQVTTVNIMAMDFGSEIADMTQPISGALQGAHAMLRQVWPHLADSDAWQMLGLTVMIGTNDDPGETVSTEAAGKLVSFVKANHVGRVAFWSLGRDQPCGESSSRGAPTCSGVDQEKNAFGHVFGTARG